jgi:hypothetical protein
LLESGWQLRAPTGRILSCHLVSGDGPGVDVCLIEIGKDAPHSSRRCANVDDARRLAERLRVAALGKGFTETIAQ